MRFTPYSVVTQADPAPDSGARFMQISGYADDSQTAHLRLAAAICRLEDLALEERIFGFGEALGKNGKIQVTVRIRTDGLSLKTLAELPMVMIDTAATAEAVAAALIH